MAEDNTPQSSDIIFYSSPTGDVKIEVIFNDETFWLTQKRMSELFGVESHTITYCRFRTMLTHRSDLC